MKKLTLIGALAVTIFTSCEKEVDPGTIICPGPEIPDCVKEHTSHLDGRWVLTSIAGESTTHSESLPFGEEILDFDLTAGIYTQTVEGYSGYPQKFTIEEMTSYVTGKTEDFIVHHWDITPFGIPIDTTLKDSVIAFEPFDFDSTVVIEPSPIVICPGPYRPSFFEIRCDILYIYSDFEGGATKVYERFDFPDCGVHMMEPLIIE